MSDSPWFPDRRKLDPATRKRLAQRLRTMARGKRKPATAADLQAAIVKSTVAVTLCPPGVHAGWTWSYMMPSSSVAVSHTSVGSRRSSRTRVDGETPIGPTAFGEFKVKKKHAGKKHAKSADRHPHFAGHRHAGYAEGETGRGGPQPGPHEFSAEQEQAMRAGPGAGAPDAGAAPADMAMGEPDADDMMMG